MDETNRITLMYQAWAQDPDPAIQKTDFLGMVMREFNCDRGEAIKKCKDALGNNIRIVKVR